jgi:hypothetical protein
MMSLRACLLVGLLSAGLFPQVVISDDSLLKQVRPFVDQYCISCHGPEDPESELRLDQLPSAIDTQEALETWQAILDQLQSSAMPPADSLQPATDISLDVMEVISGELKRAYERIRSTGGETVLRRLNRMELRNTLRDLLYLQGNADYDALLVTKLEDRNGNGQTEWNSDDPTREFPADETEGGLDTLGDRLTMSDFLLERVLEAADYSLRQATHFEEAPDFSRREYTSPIRVDGPGAGWQKYCRELKLPYDGIYQRYREPGASTGGLGRVAPSEWTRGGVGSTGLYRFTVEVSAHNQAHPWGKLIRSRQQEPMLVGLHLADTNRGGLGENPTSQQVCRWEIPGDGQRHVLTCELWMDGTWFPWVGWDNGPYERGLTAAKLVQAFYPDDFREPPGQGADGETRRTYESDMALVMLRNGYQGPHLRIHRISLEPVNPVWPPQSHVALYGKTLTEPVAKLVQEFAVRAFRRPVDEAEVQNYVRFATTLMHDGESREEALLATYTAILASPNFYYLREATGGLDDFAIASRLSYFLWSSMPDSILFELAAAKKLRDPVVLREQVDRMLSDSRANTFYRRFPERWLRIDKLGTMPPPGGFYYHRAMENEMREQVDAYFSYLVRENAPIHQVIDSDFTFLNERTAQWIYKRDDVWGDRFRKVRALPPHGGGMLTMPAVMTATANGVDTSPVVRGVWVLESLLGSAPAPPPPGVEPVAPDLRNARTIREQLIAHRAQAACSKCHERIDPLGFAFENFDELGLWRTHYRDAGVSIEIDAKIEFPQGKAGVGVDDLKQYLLDQEPRVTRNLIQTMVEYSIGRRLEPVDRPAIDELARQSKEDGGGMRDLIYSVVQSSLFQTK